MTKNAWIKPLRVLIYGLTSVGTVVGANLIKNGGFSASYANGTYAAKIQNGEIIFFTSLAILCANILWGMIRWFLRGYREKWKPKQIIGKLIGGGIWRTIVFSMLAVVSSLFVSKLAVDLVDNATLNNKLVALETSSRKIKQDYESGNISLDDYVIYLLDALYDGKKLPEKYKGEYIDVDSEVFDVVEENIDILKPETLEYFFKKITLSSVQFGDDATASSSGSMFFASAHASDGKDSITNHLNKARLTKNNKFVIFYADSGDDYTSEEMVDLVEDTLIEAVEKYESIFGEKFTYDPVKFGGDSSDEREDGFYKLLSRNGLPKNILDTALPVYMINTGAGYLAQRVTSNQNKIINTLVSWFVDGPGGDFVEETTFSFPYIMIQPYKVNNTSETTTRIVVTHELGHYYTERACRNNTLLGKPCEMGGFGEEAFANYLASVIVDEKEEGDFINEHHNNYIDLATCQTIDTILGVWNAECSSRKYDGTNLGYSGTAYLENYSEFVPDFNSKIFEIAATADVNDSEKNLLRLLYNEAGEDNFKNIIVQLAQRNLTNDYGDKKSFYAANIPPGQNLPCLDFCNDKTYRINPVSSKYFYVSTSEDIEYVDYKTGIGVLLSLVGKGVDDKWHVMEELHDSGSINVKDYASEYSVIAFVATNYNISMSSDIELGMVSTQFVNMIAKLQDTVTVGSNIYKPLGGDCYNIDTDNLFDLMPTLYDSAIGAVNLLDLHDDSYDYSQTASDLEKEKNDYQKDIAEAREELSNYEINICRTSLGNKNFNDAKKALSESIGWNINIFNSNEDNNKISVFLSLDLLTRSAKSYVLDDFGGGIELITINITEK